MTPSILYLFIIGCEASFWALLLLGLTARYLLRRQRLSNVLLLSLPTVDLVLLGATVLDLKSGAQATFAHGLAAAYVGFTVAFGGITVAWTDRRFAHRFAGAPAPTRAPTHGWPALRYELQLWARCLVAVTVTLMLVTGLIVLVNDDAKTKALHEWFMVPLGVAVAWFMFGPLWTLLFSSWRRQGDL